MEKENIIQKLEDLRDGPSGCHSTFFGREEFRGMIDETIERIRDEDNKAAAEVLLQVMNEAECGAMFDRFVFARYRPLVEIYNILKPSIE